MSRRHLATALLALGTLTLVGCGSQSAEEAEPAASAPSSAPSTPEPTADPAPEPVVLDEEVCSHLGTALREAKEVDPDAEVLIAALDAAAAGVEEELAADLAEIEAPARDFVVAIREEDRFLAPMPELPVSADLAAACEPAGVALDVIPVAVATVEETCRLVAEAGYWQDPKGVDLEEIVTFFLDRAVAHAPEELEEHVEVYYDRMLPLWDEHPDENEVDRQLRVDLGIICDEYGHFVVQPDGAGYEDREDMQQEG